MAGFEHLLKAYDVGDQLDAANELETLERRLAAH